MPSCFCTPDTTAVTDLNRLNGATGDDDPKSLGRGDRRSPALTPPSARGGPSSRDDDDDAVTSTDEDDEGEDAEDAP